jgi:tRNA(fMet)-specific endonuclease VapC
VNYLLDTDHLSELQHQQSSGRQRLVSRLASVGDDEVGACIISVEEHMRGWLASLRRHTQPRKQIHSYSQLRSLFAFYSRWEILDWNERSTDTFEALRAQRIRIATMDLKIASIAISNGLTLLTSNALDFEQVPGLVTENWLA